MNLSAAVKEMKMDKRIIDLNIRIGFVSQAEVDQHMNSLPDCADKSVALALGSSDVEDSFESAEQSLNSNNNQNQFNQ